jgi:peroxiredoxin family protein
VSARTERVTFVVFSGELDRLLAAFTMATGAAACGLDVTMFFTFWGAAFFKAGPSAASKTFVERAFGLLLRGGSGGTRLSRLHMGGLGHWLVRREMRRKGLASLDELVALARESGVRFAVCESSLALLGMDRTELAGDVELEVCGVAHMWDRAAGGQTLFV